MIALAAAAVGGGGGGGFLWSGDDCHDDVLQKYVHAEITSIQ